MSEEMTKEERRIAKRNSNLCKEATDFVVKSLEENGWEVKNLIRQSGYFIFTFGGNSVNIMQIKGLEDWRFGLWWTTHEEADKQYISGEFFCQFEDDIDKFKPSRSHFIENISIPTTKNKYHIQPYEEAKEFGNDRFNNMLNYLKHHKIYAWSEEYCWSKHDYKIPWTRFKALRHYVKHRIEQKIEHKYSDWANHKLCRFLTKNVLPAFEDGFIHHYHNMSPAYQIVIPLSQNRKLFKSRGFYSIFELTDEEKQGDNLPENWVRYCENEPKIHKKWKKLEKRYERIGEFFNIWYYNEVSKDVLVVTNKAYKSFKEDKFYL